MLYEYFSMPEEAKVEYEKLIKLSDNNLSFYNYSAIMEFYVRNGFYEEAKKFGARSRYVGYIKEAKEEAALIKQRAMVEITRQKEKAEYYLRKQSVEIAIDLAKKILEKEISEEVNRELIDEFISQVGN